jgi:HAD superfamily hydrolase (TIGR01490 family)
LKSFPRNSWGAQGASVWARRLHGADLKRDSLQIDVLDIGSDLREPVPVVASYFDVDGTLVANNLIDPTLFYLLNQAHPVQSLKRLGRALALAPAMAVAELVDRRLFNELLYGTYEGISEDRLHLLAEEVFERQMLPGLYRGARELVAKSRDAGHEIVLVSGTLDFILGKLGEHLGGCTLICNRLEMRNKTATGKLCKPVVAGPEKARLVRKHAREHAHDLDECYGFSDSYSDVPMLSVVGHPTAVNPDARLRLLARAYSWPTLKLSGSR